MQDGQFEVLLVFFLLHLYSVDICNGCKINVSDVPVNVNKNKVHFEGRSARLEWCDHSGLERIQRNC